MLVMHCLRTAEAARRLPTSWWCAPKRPNEPPTLAVRYLDAKAIRTDTVKSLFTKATEKIEQVHNALMKLLEPRYRLEDANLLKEEAAKGDEVDMRKIALVRVITLQSG
eukprot:TRINITY_DN27816_c0_g1_i1.p1 TRINITY_DN27816_c0_g1~~TRINITY_DN27816_c0_g1_i1.p1  ORF type:complete len:109 (+),score=11.16 TRINITY_DN27816_c0_g1_i1:41-367(+)